MAKAKSVLFIGRFQPFHRGHLSVLEDAFKKFDFVIVGIGSSDKFRTLENPFTVGERHAMVKHTLEELKVKPNHYKVVPIPDIDDDANWVQHVIKTCPNFEIVISGNSKVTELFKRDSKKKVLAPKMKYRISSTNVREAISKGEPLIKYLHSAVISFLQKIGATQRIMEPLVQEAKEEKAS